MCFKIAQQVLPSPFCRKCSPKCYEKPAVLRGTTFSILSEMILLVNSDRNSVANISNHYAHQGGELPACFRCLVVGPVNPTMSDVEQRAPSKEAQKKPALWSHVWPIDVWTGILTELDILPMQSGNGIVEQECTRQ